LRREISVSLYNADSNVFRITDEFQAQERPVRQAAPFVEFYVQRNSILFAGRNGGHLTPAAFLHFSQRQALFDTVEAKKSYDLEQHTTSLLLQIIEENSWTSDLDLVEGGHVSLLFTKKEEEDARKDYEMARQAGLDLDDVEWLPKEKVQEVVILTHHFLAEV